MPKTPETVSRTRICTRSGKNFYRVHKVCTEKIILSKIILSKNYRIIIRIMTNLELREEVVED